MDGDFDEVRSNKRQLLSSPDWTTERIKGVKSRRIGIQDGMMSSGGNEIVWVTSPTLNQNRRYAKPIARDIIHWRFAATSEHRHDAAVSLSLQFADQERVQVDKKPVPGGPAEFATRRPAYWNLTKKNNQFLSWPAITFRIGNFESNWTDFEHRSLKYPEERF